GRSRLLTATGGITDFSWSPDGLTLAYVCDTGRDEGREAHLLEVESGRDTVRPHRISRCPMWRAATPSALPFGALAPRRVEP
ncbi:MAG: hypothetical protein K6T75_11625, partial [Acetobacteraceae bacterium]|nr:hypothetical protein [Acetobacteraceae bacterium]